MSRYPVVVVCALSAAMALAMAVPQQVEDVDAFVERTLSDLNSGQLDLQSTPELVQRITETQNGIISVVEAGERTYLFAVNGTVVQSYELVEGVLFDLSGSAVLDNAVLQPPCGVYEGTAEDNLFAGEAEGNLFDIEVATAADEPGQVGNGFPCWVHPTGEIMICVFQNEDKVRMVIFCRYPRPGNPPWIWKKCGDSGWLD